MDITPPYPNRMLTRLEDVVEEAEIPQRMK
jgi:hypothetical protein